MKGEFTQKGKEALERFKMEAASEVGVNLKQGYNGDLTSRAVSYTHLDVYKRQDLTLIYFVKSVPSGKLFPQLSATHQ